jgi:putative spermidine/putrescine transport system permease protein
MQSAEHGWISTVFRIVAGLGVLYMLLPIALMLPLSLEPGNILRFPDEDFSLRWYTEYFANEAWIASTIVTLKVALGASAVATILGTLAAKGATKVSPAVRRACMALLLSPIALPTILIAVAIYGIYTTLHLVGSIAGLIAAHAVLTTPIVILNVSTALAALPPELDDAASSLGASPLRAFFSITVPLIARGIAAGAVLSFIISFDEVVIGMFLSGAHVVTLPKRMLDGVFYEMTPMLAAVSSLLVFANILCVTVFLLMRTRSQRAA